MGIERFMDSGLRALSGILGRDRLAILIYHRVLPATDSLNTWDVAADLFERQVLALRKYFNPLPLSEAVERLMTNSLPRRAVSVTFDDGYADNAAVAGPILTRHGVHATFFVATGNLDGGRMWNDTVVESLRVLPGPSVDLSEFGLGVLLIDSLDARRAAIGRILPAWKHLSPAERQARANSLAARAGLHADSALMMSTAQLRSLHAAGMEIGAHSVTHPILTRIGDGDARREIVESGERLAELLREPIRLFAYPNGKPGEDFGPQHVRMVRDAGYAAAMTTAWGVSTAATDRFQLPRFTPWDRDPRRFSLRLALNFRKTAPQTVVT